MFRAQDSDDEAPPELSSLPSQTSAYSAAVAILPSGSRPVVRKAEVSCSVQSLSSTDRPTRSIKRGFFDAKPTRKTQGRKAGLQILRARDSECPDIPKDFILPADEHQVKLQQHKAALLEKMKPTEDTMQSVLQNPALLAGFDDPEVMRAVSDIAANPHNVSKYKNKPKVLEFYKHMGTLMGSKLDNADGTAK